LFGKGVLGQFNEGRMKLKIGWHEAVLKMFSFKLCMFITDITCARLNSISL